MECGQKESVRPNHKGGADLLNRGLAVCASTRGRRCLAERRNLLLDVIREGVASCLLQVLCRVQQICTNISKPGRPVMSFFNGLGCPCVKPPPIVIWKGLLFRYGFFS